MPARTYARGRKAGRTEGRHNHVRGREWRAGGDGGGRSGGGDSCGGMWGVVGLGGETEGEIREGETTERMQDGLREGGWGWEGVPGDWRQQICKCYEAGDGSGMGK